MKNINPIPIILLAMIFMCTGVHAQSNQFQPLPCLNKNFTIVAQVLLNQNGGAGITEAAIQANVDYANELFEPICVSFEICEFRYIDNYQYDDLEEETTTEWEEVNIKYHVRNRINMFFFSTMEEPNCGFAPLGGITNLTSGSIAIQKDCVDPMGNTIPHELGHYFGLLHTFENPGSELVDGSNCDTAGDLVCDTPADFANPGDEQNSLVNDDCIFVAGITDSNGDWFDPDTGNIMSYYSGCTCRFTHGQYLRMANTYLSGPGMW